jgi:hypothetical protein
VYKALKAGSSTTSKCIYIYMVDADNRSYDYNLLIQLERGNKPKIRKFNQENNYRKYIIFFVYFIFS